jgi:hypothetical protein
MPQDAWTPDRRRSDRRRVTFPLMAEVEGIVSPAPVRELGSGGMVVECGRPLPAGARMTFSLGNGADATGPMEGHVAHSRLMLTQRHADTPVYLTGVAFIRIAPDQAARVAGWLAVIDQHGPGRSTRVP